MPPNLAKRKLGSGEVIIGMPVLEFATPGIARIMETAGADFAIFDMEHAAFGIDTIRALVSYARGTTVTPFVRVPTARYEYIASALDVGALGVIVPLVETLDQVERIVEAAKYPPIGRRGVAYGIAHDDFNSGGGEEKLRLANQETLVIALIETETGLKNLEQIASHPELDVLWVGHNDLAASLGMAGDPHDPVLATAIESVAKAAARHGKAAGRGVPDPDSAIHWIEKGFRALAYSRDIQLLQSNLARGLADIRARLRV
jgi:2-keto-3-deoxy-L-rhamnonate aldolase RhmA